MDHIPFPVIRTERLLLRAVRDSDLDSLFRMYSNPLVSEYDSFCPIKSTGEARQLLASSRDEYRTGKRIPWGIALQSDDLLIGTCSLLNFAEAPKHCEIGCAITPEMWHKGYAVEAMGYAMKYAFDMLGLEMILAYAAPENAASHLMLQRLGFARLKTIKNRSFYKGRFHDEVSYQKSR